MSRLDEATHRLHAALDRLERAVDGRLQADGGEAEEALEAARAENAELRRTADHVSERLDAAIARLRTVLEA